MTYSFILVGPKVPENIGASARALKTMGFDSLVLVDPCDDPEERAQWLAHGSHEVLDKAKTYPSLKDASADYDLLVATTTRKRKIQDKPIALTKLNSFIREKGNTVSKIAIVFGNEESGLSNSDISLCHISSEIPLAVEFPSLNLSQAVMLYAYELAALSKKAEKQNNSDPLKGNSLRVIRDKVEEVLRETGISDNPALSGKILERLAHADGKDLNLVHSVSGAILDIIKESKIK